MIYAADINCEIRFMKRNASLTGNARQYRLSSPLVNIVDAYQQPASFPMMTFIFRLRGLRAIGVDIGRYLRRSYASLIGFTLVKCSHIFPLFTYTLQSIINATRQPHNALTQQHIAFQNAQYYDSTS